MSKKKDQSIQNNSFVAQNCLIHTGDKEKLLEAGFDDYISKPINHRSCIQS